MAMVDQWFGQMKELRTKTITYERLCKRDGLRPPVRQVCQLLGIDNLTKVFSEDLLKRTIVRVAEMQVEEKAADVEPIYDATSLRSASSIGVVDSTIRIPPPQNGHDFVIGELERPWALNALLEVVKKSETAGKDKYTQFLTLADEAQNEMIRSGMINIAPRFMQTAAKPEKKVATNSSSWEILVHYCVTETFTSTIQPDTITAALPMKKVMEFCDDFELSPKLITKDEIRLVLTVMNVRNAHLDSTKIHALDFDHFSDFLIRVALFAYHKPPVKACIMNFNNGKMPSKLEVVDYLCQYLHLDDLQWVRDRLRSTKPVVKTCTFGNIALSPPKLGQGDPAHNVERPTSPRLVVSYIEPVTPQNLPFLKEKDRQNRLLEGIKTKSSPKTLPTQIESLFAANVARLEAEETEREGDQMSLKSPLLVTPSVAGRGSLHGGNTAAAGGHKGKGTSGSMNSPFGGGGGGSPGSSGSGAGVPSAVTDEQRQLISSDLDSSLYFSLGRYAQHRSHRPQDTLWCPSNGCFIDMGRLTVGWEIEIQLSLTNNSRDQMHLDTTCSGLASPDTRVVTKPPSLAPGMSRTVSVLFTVQPGDRTAVGTIQVFVASIRTGLGLVYNVPVHYRVGPPHPETDDYPCTLSNFDQLKSRYLGERGVKTLELHRTNAEMQDTAERYDITKFPKIDMNSVNAPATFSTLGSI